MSGTPPLRSVRHTRLNRHLITHLWQGAVALVLIVAFLLPVYWMITTALKTTADTFAVPPVLIFQPTFEHFRVVYEEGSVARSLVNSLIVATSATLLSVLIGAPAAYVLARFNFRGKADLWFWIITNRFISPIVVALPFFLIARDLRILDKHIALILVYLTFGIPLVVWLCVDQFRAVPREVDEAATVDGANLWQVFFRINLPLAMPGIVVSAILAFIASWNELMFALVLTRAEARTAPVEAANFMTGFGIRWGPMMATGTLIVLPVLIFALLVSRNLVRGLTMGAVK
ncbi:MULTISPECIES: carbohydrate ABC transporter permease [Caldilinea]|jgi:multiple sugar transport system permease protein|uniref:carbohydrate ABC transporter permease n=1 Tax=Caldilinea TaxID=233191 RepID=UPI0005C69173|nr:MULTISPECIES: carbohydrate ABC transporter permease [Caldilinea]MBO9392030.1 carbohydrate ABC transporter permease [Caldilinea sp.]GIV73689.1 MAG: binding-protein-dependent transport systems inner membrane component [Caldilinea sp.]